MLGVVLALRIIFKLIDLADEWTRERSVEVGREEELEPLIVLLTRASACSMPASRFGQDLLRLEQIGKSLSRWFSGLCSVSGPKDLLGHPVHQVKDTILLEAADPG